MIETINTPPRHERGMVMIYALVILVVLGYLGASSMQVALISERLSSNHQDYALAEHKANSAINVAEDWLRDSATRATLGQNLVAGTSTTIPVVWALGAQSGSTLYSGEEDSTWILEKDDQWWIDRTLAAPGFDDTYYFTEFVGVDRDSLAQDGNYSNQSAGNYYYRVTSKAEGGLGAREVLQMVYLVKID